VLLGVTPRDAGAGWAAGRGREEEEGAGSVAGLARALPAPPLLRLVTPGVINMGRTARGK